MGRLKQAMQKGWTRRMVGWSPVNPQPLPVKGLQYISIQCGCSIHNVTIVRERMGVRDKGYGAYILYYHLRGSRTFCRLTLQICQICAFLRCYNTISSIKASLPICSMVLYTLCYGIELFKKSKKGEINWALLQCYPQGTIPKLCSIGPINAT